MSDSEELTVPQLAALTSGSTAWKSAGIPGVVDALALNDGPHGVRRQSETGDSLGIGDSIPATCFPPAVGLASSWNDDLIERVAAQLGREAKALGVSALLGPGLNIKRSPLCGRNFEYPSEDPYVAGRYGVAFVRGVQSQGVAATPKHFAVNNQEDDRFRVSAQVDDRTLREIYLPAFERVITQAEPWALMSAYNRINGVPASENVLLLHEILRREWGFDGLVMSDWGAVDDRVAALNAGLDLEMPPSGSDERIVDAVAEGTVSRQRLEEVLERLALLADRTRGVGDRPDPERIDVETGDQLALLAAHESAVLLSNDGVLPLRVAGPVAVIGEFARTPRFQGGGSSQVCPTRVSTALEAMRDQLGAQAVRFAPGFTLDDEASSGGDALADEAVELARAAEVAVVFAGLPPGSESEGFDRETLELPAQQVALLERLVELDTPVIVVVSCGSIVTLGPWSERANAILMGWLLGQAGGRGTADLLTGRVAPSGRLTETIPLALSDTPSFLNFPGQDGVVVYGEGLFVGYRYYDTVERAVRFPFGHGLTYTTFEYSQLTTRLAGPNTVEVGFTVTNTGAVAGAEVPQVYVARECPGRPRHELRHYRKVLLAPGESQRVAVLLDERAFSVWDTRAGAWTTVADTWTVEVGASSRDIRLASEVTTQGPEHPPSLARLSTVGEWLDHPVGGQLVAPMMERFADRFGGLDKVDPALLKMFEQMPLIKLTAWGVGFTQEAFDAMLQDANTATPGAQ